MPNWVFHLLLSTEVVHEIVINEKLNRTTWLQSSCILWPWMLIVLEWGWFYLDLIHRSGSLGGQRLQSFWLRTKPEQRFESFQGRPFPGLDGELPLTGSRYCCLHKEGRELSDALIFHTCIRLHPHAARSRATCIPVVTPARNCGTSYDLTFGVFFVYTFYFLYCYCLLVVIGYELQLFLHCYCMPNILL